MEDDKRGDRNLAKAEAARRLARIQRGAFWIGTERTLTQQRHYNLVFLHARRKNFPAFADIAVALQNIWPWGEMASVEEIASRFEQRWPVALVEAAIWKVVGRQRGPGHLLVDLEQFTLDRMLPLCLTSTRCSTSCPILSLTRSNSAPVREQEPVSLPERSSGSMARPLMPLRYQSSEGAVSPQSPSCRAGAGRSITNQRGQRVRHRAFDALRLVQRTRQLGQIACMPHGSYVVPAALHPAFQECIRRLFCSPHVSR